MINETEILYLVNRYRNARAKPSNEVFYEVHVMPTYLNQDLPDDLADIVAGIDITMPSTKVKELVRDLQEQELMRDFLRTDPEAMRNYQHYKTIRLLQGEHK